MPKHPPKTNQQHQITNSQSTTKPIIATKQTPQQYQNQNQITKQIIIIAYTTRKLIQTNTLKENQPYNPQK